MDITQVERGKAPKVKMNYIVRPCMHCEDAPCKKAASGGAVYTRSDGIVIIDPLKSVGQQQLVSACPYGAIYWNPSLNIPQKCTMCAHLLDAGSSEPRCAGACPTDAITFGELETLKATISASGAITLHPEYGTQPRVYYIGLPQRWVTGAVIDSKGEYVMGATVTLTDFASGALRTATTDGFGDFWIDGLDAGKTFKVVISKAGMFSKTIVAYVGTDKDLGDIKLVGV